MTSQQYPEAPPELEIETYEQVWYHGYVRSPRSRVVAAVDDKLVKVQDPQSIEAFKGYPKYEHVHKGQVQHPPPDGKLASAGLAPYAPLDAPKLPNGKDWPAMTVSPGGTIRWSWWLTACHKTEKWHYWITKDDWDPSKPLTRAQFEPEPMATLHWHMDPNTADWMSPLPIQDVHHWIKLPKKTGRHVIYAVWDVADTANAFYQVTDVNFDPSFANEVVTTHTLARERHHGKHHGDVIVTKFPAED